MLIHSPKELAQWVHTQRKKKRWSQAETSALVGLKQTTLSKFEIRPDHTRLATLFRILSALGLEMHVMPQGKSPAEAGKWSEKW
jgi:HTH-type transcriptional regulator / antitoxin HipB